MKNIFFRKSLNAFTLAEVLITLGIIGVVAAMTMPTLVSNHQKAVLKTQFKKSFSTIAQAYDAAAANLGYYPACYYWENGTPHHCVEYGADNECIKYIEDETGNQVSGRNFMGPRQRCRALANALEESLKIVKKCDGNAYSGGCIPRYEGIDTARKAANDSLTDAEITQQTSGCNGYRQNNILNKSKAYVLADGTIYITYGQDEYWNAPLFLIDVNGKKGPNKWGHDLFSLELQGSIGKEYSVAPTNTCGVIEPGGIHPQNLLLEK